MHDMMYMIWIRVVSVVQGRAPWSAALTSRGTIREVTKGRGITRNRVGLLQTSRRRVSPWAPLKMGVKAGAARSANSCGKS